MLTLLVAALVAVAVVALLVTAGRGRLEVQPTAAEIDGTCVGSASDSLDFELW